ncbi:hypothetical protein ONR75_30800 [Rhodopseudomonas sp. P2A-2r]|uniref:hypothetical protein n=1 Tax=Rhodopseudomonas sp. P2A-2r TaxID=2991972 RepID=UPI002234A09F|nr:hypothetical protein [Rhodopseudomonas sp. P2A-2r]UZE49048.1 hypothetical protein ONR75_30800 [Rhodopseudomonas sp. P2A-2r]
MSNQTTAQHSTVAASALERVGRDPAQLFTVEAYWNAFGDPVELLASPAQTFASNTASLAALCEEHRIPHRHDDQGHAFPVWLLREFYPANP